MADEKVWTAALLVIGDEILSGRTQDKNVVQVATWLNRQGIRLEEVRVVPDVEARIVGAVNALRGSYDYLFTTGGIGPTHDDITVDSIAAAFGVPVVIHPDARAILEDYYATRGGADRRAAADGARSGRRRPDRQSDVRRARRADGKRLHHGRACRASRPPCSQRSTASSKAGGRSSRRPSAPMRAESEVADLLRETEAAHAGVAIGSYPFFKDGRYGANFVMRSDDGELVERDCERSRAAPVRGRNRALPRRHLGPYALCGDRLSSRSGARVSCRTMKAGRRSS